MKNVVFSARETKVQQLLFSDYGAVRKFTASLLIVLFVSPPFTAFAQEAPTDNADTNAPALPDVPSAEIAPVELPESSLADSGGAPSTEPSAEGEAVSTSDGEVTPPEDGEEETMALSSIGGAPDPGIRSVEGRVRVSPDEMSGSLVYSIDLVSPPGRNGLQPNLKLTYNSNNSDIGNWFGAGWSLNIPYIERVNKKGTDNLYSTTTNYFYSSLSGELATTTSASNFAAKNDDGSFVEYIFSNNIWTATDKRGNVYKFGSTTASRQDDPNDSTRIYKWMLEEIRDTNDNYIKYVYTKDRGQIYPLRISYTGNGTTDGPFDVEFTTEARADFATSSATAFPVVTRYRISEVRGEINNTWRQKYSFGYATSSTGVRSLLNTITESGQDESAAITTLPATDFDYATTTQGWTTDVTWTMPGVDFVDPGTHLVDLNGDGLTDAIQSDGTVNVAYLNDGDGTWTEDSNYDAPVNLDFIQNYGVGLVDLNGDGLVDVYNMYNTTNNVYLNNGNGWTLNTSWTMPPGDYQEEGTYLVDVNGDGLTDVMFSRGFTSTNVTYINNGNGTWTEDSQWDSPIYLDYDQEHGAGIAELNGDGLPDVYRGWDTSPVINVVYLNNGHGWTLTPGWGTANPSMPYGNAGYTYIDLNGDGLSDFVGARAISGAKASYINKGDGTWMDAPGWYHPGWLTDFGNGITDLDGDRLPDIFEQYDENWVRLNNTQKVDLLVRVQNHTGGATTYEYKATPEYRSGGSLQNPELPYSLYTVSAIGESDGMGSIATTTYSYSGGGYYYNNAFDRRLAGFETIAKTDPDGNITKTYYHQGNTTNSSLGEFSDHQSKIGREFRIENQDSSGTAYKKSVFKWENTGLGNNRNLVTRTRTTTLDYDGNGTHKDSAETSTYNSTTGNLTQKVAWGEVTGSDDGSFTDTGNDKFTFDFTYASSSTSKVKALPSLETQSDQAAAKVAETRHYFDNLALHSIGKGNETKTEKWKTSTSYASTTKTYNSFGLVTQETDPRGKVTTHTIDSFNLYVATTTNPLTHATGYQYNYALGKAKEVRDPNGRVYQTIYDGLGRVKEEKQPDLTTPTTLVTKTAYTYADNVVPTYTRETKYLNAATSTEKYSYFDGLKRLKQERAESETSYAVRDYKYNARGLLSSESLPYFSSGASSTAATTNGALYTNYIYDPLNRALTVANSVGTTTNAYDDWKTTVTDPNGEVKILYNDAYANLSRVDEVTTSTYTTNYEYNGLKKLTKITDALSNVRNFTYDGLGRRITAQDLHAPADGTFGTWTYTYDDADNVTQTLDPKSQTINYTYDDINRPLTEDFTGLSGTEIQYAYDYCGDGKGRLCVATTTDAITTYAYNANGLPASETKKISNTNYTTSYLYDRIGNLTDITYPDASIVKYGFDAAGLLETVARKPNGSSAFLTAISELQYSPTGAISFKKFGNGVTSTYTFDAAKQYRLTNILTLASSTVQGGGGGSGGPLGFAPSKYFASADTKATNPIYTVTKAVEQLLAVEFIDDTISTLAPAETTVANVAVEPYVETVDAYKQNKGDISVELKKTKPEVRLKKWYGEVDLGVTYGKVKGQGNLAASTNRVEWKDGDEELHAYPLPATDGMADGGFEIEVFLKAKPAANIFEFNLEGTQNLDFFYQPELTQLEKDNGASRPENVIGSYAVYHKEKKDKIGSGTNYGTGKAFHIYRPKAIDAAGKETWGVLAYKNDVLSVEIPQSFFNSATYPVRVDPTFGYATTGASYQDLAVSTNDVSNRVGNRGTLSATGTLSSLHASLDMDGGAADVIDASIFLNREDTSTDSHAQVAKVERTDISWSTTDTFYTFTAAGESLDADDYVLNIIADGADVAGLLNIGRISYDSTGSRSNYLEAYNFGTYTTGRDETPWTETDTTGSRLYSMYATYTVSGGGNQSPTAPTSLQTEDLTNPTDITDSTPEFDAIFNDPDATSTATYFQIQVSTSSSFSPIKWDSGKTALASSTPPGMRIADISYGGTGLASSTTHYWRIKFWDQLDAVSPWSTATSTFSLAASSGGGGSASTTILQNISYTYDAVGNITKITDHSGTGAGKIANFAYDDLHRLTSASTSVASSTPFAHTYAYDALGNITNMSNQGAYTYSGSGHLNPHAVSQFANGLSTTTYAYDNNGNVTTAGAWTHAWDYRNRLATSTNGTATTYGYDHNNERVRKTVGAVSTIYPNKYFNVSGASTTVHIYLPDGSPVATVELKSNGTATTSEFYDSFTEASTNTALTSHTPDQGGSWSSLIQVGAACDLQANATADNLQKGTCGTSQGRLYRTQSVATSADVEVSVKQTDGDSSDDYNVLACRIQDANNMYAFKWNETNGQLYKRVSGTWSTLGSATAAVADNSIVKLLCQGSTISAIDDGVTIRSVTDTSITAAGYGGIGMGAVITSTDDADLQKLDDFRMVKYSTTNTATTTAYIHTDHLGSTNVTSSNLGVANEVVDYLPFGTQRLKTGSFTEQKKFTGHEYDQSSDLTYAKARYYEQDIGRFLSQDPVFRDIGVDRRTGLALIDPQIQNSYAYSRNNPIVYRDESGEFPLAPLLILVVRAAIVSGLIGSISESSQQIYSQLANQQRSTPHQVLTENLQTTFSDATAGAFEPFGVFAESAASGIAAFHTSNQSSLFSRLSEGSANAASVFSSEVVARKLPGVSGKDVSTFSKYFFDGAHTQRQALIESIEKSLSEIYVKLGDLSAQITTNSISPPEENNIK